MAAAVSDNPSAQRFELRDEGQLLGWLDYRPAGKSVILAHTEVDEAQGGKGYGGVLVRGALEELAARGQTALPTCPFASDYIHRHPDLARFVDPSLRPQFLRP